jgi:hypothetical protein
LTIVQESGVGVWSAFGFPWHLQCSTCSQALVMAMALALLFAFNVCFAFVFIGIGIHVESCLPFFAEMFLVIKI